MRDTPFRLLRAALKTSNVATHPRVRRLPGQPWILVPVRAQLNALRRPRRYRLGDGCPSGIVGRHAFASNSQAHAPCRNLRSRESGRASRIAGKAPRRAPAQPVAHAAAHHLPRSRRTSRRARRGDRVLHRHPRTGGFPGRKRALLPGRRRSGQHRQRGGRAGEPVGPRRAHGWSRRARHGSDDHAFRDTDAQPRSERDRFHSGDGTGRRPGGQLRGHARGARRQRRPSIARTALPGGAAGGAGRRHAHPHRGGEPAHPPGRRGAFLGRGPGQQRRRGAGGAGDLAHHASGCRAVRRGWPVRRLRLREHHGRRAYTGQRQRHDSAGFRHHSRHGPGTRALAGTPPGGKGRRRRPLHLGPVGARRPRLHRHLGHARRTPGQSAICLDAGRPGIAHPFRFDRRERAHGERRQDPGGRPPRGADPRGRPRRAQRGHVLRPVRSGPPADHQPLYRRPGHRRPQRVAGRQLRLSGSRPLQQRTSHPRHLRSGFTSPGRQLLRWIKHAPRRLRPGRAGLPVALGRGARHPRRG